MCLYTMCVYGLPKSRIAFSHKPKEYTLTYTYLIAVYFFRFLAHTLYLYLADESVKYVDQNAEEKKKKKMKVSSRAVKVSTKGYDAQREKKKREKVSSKKCPPSLSCFPPLGSGSPRVHSARYCRVRAARLRTYPLSSFSLQ